MSTTTSSRIEPVPLLLGGCRDQAPLAVLFVCWGPLGLWRLWFLPQGTAARIPGLPLLFQAPPLSWFPFSSDFGRRPKRKSGFQLAATSYARDQWRSMRRIDPPKPKVKSEEDDRLPKWETPSTVPKVDWETSISTLKKTVTTLTEPPESVIFGSSKFPPSLLHVEADLKSNRAFKDEVLRTDAAGACGLAFVRCGEIAHATLGKFSKFMAAMKTAVTGDRTRTPSGRSCGTPLRN
jgi:hypothetical protein